MNKEHSVVFVPGLGDYVRLFEHLTKDWRKYGLKPVIHRIGWRDKEVDFQPRLQRLLKLIDDLFGNEIVPGRTSALEGSYDRQIPMAGHMPTIVAALTVHSKPITIFLNEGVSS